MKPVLIHTHFHKRSTGVTRSIENIFPYLYKHFDAFIYGYNIDGNKIGFAKLISILFSNKTTVVHCHRNNEIIRVLLHKLFGAKLKIIVTRHSSSEPSWLTKLLFKKVDKIITLNKNVSQKLGIDNILIGHGVKIDNFKPNFSKKNFEISQENIILNIGRVREKKGQIILLEASKILNKHKNWALVFVGKVEKQSFLKKLKKISNSYNIKNQVYFIEETKDIIPYYQAAKLFVAPSFSEGFSLVTLEAMACECTVIATEDVGIHSELIAHNKNGYLFKAGSINELKNLLSQLIENKIPHLGKQARLEVVENWTTKKEANKLIKVYKSFF